jgi:hypothetical protein
MARTGVATIMAIIGTAGLTLTESLNFLKFP